MSISFLPIVHAIPGYTLISNNTEDLIGISNISTTDWHTSTTDCYNSPFCVIFTPTSTRYGDYDYNNSQSILNNPVNQSFILQGWLYTGNSGGNEDACFMYDMTAGGNGAQPPSGQNYSTACIQTTAGGLLRIQTIQTGTINSVAYGGTLTDYFWVVMNDTGTQTNLYIYAKDQTTLLLSASNLPRDFGSTHGFIGFASIDSTRFDSIEFYKLGTITPPSPTLMLSTNLIDGTITNNNNLSISINGTLTNPDTDLFDCALFNNTKGISNNIDNLIQINITQTNYFNLSFNNTESNYTFNIKCASNLGIINATSYLAYFFGK